MAILQTIVLSALAIAGFWGGIAVLGWVGYKLTDSVEGTAAIIVVAVSILAVFMGYTW